MVERPHGVESMGGMPRSGFDRSLRDWHLGVRVPNADANIAPRRFRDHFHRAGNLRCNRQHAHMPACRLPEALEDLERRRDQIFRRMHAAPLVAEKRSLEMNAQRPGLHAPAVAGLVSSSMASANRSSAAQVASSGAATVVGKYPVTP